MQSGLRGMRPVEPSALRSTLGFACNQGFVFSLFYLGPNRALDAGPVLFERADLFATLAFMVLSFALLRAAAPRARDALLSRALLWCYALLLVVGSALPVLVGPAPGTVLAEGLLVGASAGLMLAAWGRAFGRMPSERCLPEVFVSSALAAAVCLAFWALPWEGAPLALKLLALGSAFALKGLAPFSEEGARQSCKGGSAPSPITFGDLVATKEQRVETARLSRKMLTGTVLFGLAAGFMETFSSEPGMASNPAIGATLLVLVLFCTAALQLMAGDARASQDGRGAQSPLDGVYRLAVLVMMAGFLFVPVLGSFGVTGEAVVLAGYLGLISVLISLFLLMAKLTGQDAAAAFAGGFAALYLGEMAGIVLGNVIESLEPAGEAPYAVAAFAGLAALYAYLFLFTERDFGALSVIVRDADRFDDACRVISSEHGLSKRESEILPLALRGRTGERIAGELFISKSTVDTHLRRIYAKTGTHGRQELIDLGERTVRRLGGK